MSTEPLEKDALDLALAALPGWRLDGDKLKKTFVRLSRCPAGGSTATS